MVCDIEGGSGGDKDDVGAQLFGLANTSTGSDAIGFRFVTCGDDGGTVAVGGAYGNGFPEEFGVFGLLDTCEVGVEV